MRKIATFLLVLLGLSTVFAAQDKKTQSNQSGAQRGVTVVASKPHRALPQDQYCQPGYLSAYTNLSSNGGGVPGKSCTSGGKANWYERSLVCHEERSMRRNRS